MAGFQNKDRADHGNSGESEITRLVRDGVRPEGLKGRLDLAVDKALGNVPLGVDAPNKTVRKMIGGGWELLHVLKFGFFGGLSSLFGIAFLYVGLAGKSGFVVPAVGAVLLVLGIWCLRAAREAYRSLRAISKA
jgi:hypothetical protein